MATRVGKRVQGDLSSDMTVIWTGLANTDDGQAAYIGDLENVSVQAIGDGTSVAMQGSNDGTTWAALGGGVTLTIAAGTSPVTNINNPRPRYIRPVCTGGTATTVIISGSHAR